MAQEVLIYISLIITISAVLAVIARMIKQPAIIAYIVSGIIVGPLVLNWIGVTSPSAGVIQAFARIGVALLLFIVGLSLDFRVLREIGKTSTIAGLTEIILVGLVGFFVSTWLGFSNIIAFYIGAVIAFSSTVVVVKILSDKKEMETLHGKIALGILIVQDIIASILLMIIPFIDGKGSWIVIAEKLGLAIITIAAIFVISGLFLKKFLGYLAKSQEALFIFGIAWALVISVLFSGLGFSIEIGALIAGMSLASTKYALDLESRIKPLRDFFVVLFFVFFGSQLTGPITLDVWKSAIILSLLVMIIKPLIVMTTLKFLGYTKRTNFLASVSLAQVSEFSLILVLLGFSFGHVGQDIINIAILVALITIALSAYMINFSSFLSLKLMKYLDFFEGKISNEKELKKKNYDIVLFGYHRIAYKLINAIKQTKMSFVIVDYNPKVVQELNKQNIESIYGDAANQHFLNEINLSKAKLIISTIPDEHSNLTILEMLKEEKSNAVFIATAEQPRAAVDLYKEGADYVIVPHHLGGEYASEIVKKFKTNKEEYKKLGKEHLKSLNKAKNNSTFNLKI